MKSYTDHVSGKYQSQTAWFDINLPWSKRDTTEITVVAPREKRVKRGEEKREWLDGAMSPLLPTVPCAGGKGFGNYGACSEHQPPHRAPCRWERVWKLRRTQLASTFPTVPRAGGKRFGNYDGCARLVVKAIHHRHRARWALLHRRRVTVVVKPITTGTGRGGDNT